MSNDEKIKRWISETDDRKKLEDFSVNAREKGREDLALEALKRSWSLAGLDHSDSLHRDFESMLAAYEHYLYEKHGKRVKANYTRRALGEKGVIATLEDWALNPIPTPGFKRLIEAGLAKFAGESVILRHAERFSPAIVQAAEKRLREFGVDAASVKT